MYISTFCALFNIVTNYFGIRNFGYIACAYTTWISYILFCVGHFYFYNKVRHKEIGKNYPFNSKIVIVTGIIVSVYSVGITLIYKFVLIRYTLLMFVIILALVKKKVIIRIIGEIRKDSKTKMEE